MKTLIDIPTKMKALVLHGVGDLRYEEVDVPTLKEGTVLLKIKACGICSSDIPRIFVNGTYHFPTIPGHEFSGQIVAVGDNVDESLLGKKSCVFPMLPCRKCKACEIEQWAQCSGYSYFGSRCDGAFAEYLVVPTWNLVPFDDRLSYEEAALCEPAAVSLHAINIANLKDGQNVMIIGKVIVCGRSDNKLDYAKKSGFENITLKKENVSESIKNIVGCDSVDVTFEAVGSNNSIETAIKSTGAFGRVVLVGNPTEDLHIEKNAYWSILRKQMTLAGSWNSNFNSKVNDWQEALRIFESGSLNLKDLITHTFPISESEKAFDTLKSKDIFTIKVMFTFD